MWSKKGLFYWDVTNIHKSLFFICLRVSVDKFDHFYEG